MDTRYVKSGQVTSVTTIWRTGYFTMQYDAVLHSTRQDVGYDIYCIVYAANA